MSALAGTLASATVAFTVSNVDSAALLVALFAAARSAGARVAPIALGQFVALELLAVVSLAGAGVLSDVGNGWFALLGLCPLLLGLHRLVVTCRNMPAGEVAADAGRPGRHVEVFTGVVAIMLLSGGDNIGVYVPLLRKESVASLCVSMICFVVLDLLMCLLTWRLANSALLARLLDRVAAWIVPFVLIGIGVVVLAGS